MTLGDHTLCQSQRNCEYTAVYLFTVGNIHCRLKEKNRAFLSDSQDGAAVYC